MTTWNIRSTFGNKRIAKKTPQPLNNALGAMRPQTTPGSKGQGSAMIKFKDPLNVMKAMVNTAAVDEERMHYGSLMSTVENVVESLAEPRG